VGEGLSLQDWLNKKIFPAEDRLTPDGVYWGAMLGIAEMIRFGTVSLSDMYFFSDAIARPPWMPGSRRTSPAALWALMKTATFPRKTGG
jgi:5-methylthioadenosine/S-adenosylhomocysteine deaminase